MKKYLSFALLITFFISMSLVIAKGVSNNLLENGTHFIIYPNETVMKFVDGKIIDEPLEIKKHSYFLFDYFEFKYNSTKDKVPITLQLPPDETLIKINPQPIRYNSETENGKTLVSVTWEGNPNFVIIEYGNIFANFLRNLQLNFKIG